MCSKIIVPYFRYTLIHPIFCFSNWSIILLLLTLCLIIPTNHVAKLYYLFTLNSMYHALYWNFSWSIQLVSFSFRVVCMYITKVAALQDCWIYYQVICFVFACAPRWSQEKYLRIFLGAACGMSYIIFILCPLYGFNQSINQSIQQMFLQYWRSSLHMVYKLNGI